MLKTSLAAFTALALLSASPVLAQTAQPATGATKSMPAPVAAAPKATPAPAVTTPAPTNAAAATTAPKQELLDINSATATQLEALPGMARRARKPSSRAARTRARTICLPRRSFLKTSMTASRKRSSPSRNPELFGQVECRFALGLRECAYSSRQVLELTAARRLQDRRAVCPSRIVRPICSRRPPSASCFTSNGYCSAPKMKVSGSTPNALNATQKSVPCVRQTISFSTAMTRKNPIHRQVSNRQPSAVRLNT